MPPRASSTSPAWCGGPAREPVLGNAFLSHIRETDAVAMVVRCFVDPDIIHVEGEPDPLRDIEIINLEMALADLSTLAKRIDKLEREARVNPKIAPRHEAAKRLKRRWKRESPPATFAHDSLEGELARESFLLTAKPVLYVANVDEAQIAAPGPLAKAVFDRAAGEGSRAIAFCGKIESELAGWDEEAESFRGDLGIESSGLDQLILGAYDLLGLMTYLTAGRKEVRAWTIERGSRAPQAAGKIHSDIEKGFIRAEIVSYADYARLRSMEALRAAGSGALRGQGVRDAGGRRGEFPVQRLSEAKCSRPNVETNPPRFCTYGEE